MKIKIKMLALQLICHPDENQNQNVNPATYLSS